MNAFQKEVFRVITASGKYRRDFEIGSRYAKGTSVD